MFVVHVRLCPLARGVVNSDRRICQIVYNPGAERILSTRTIAKKSCFCRDTSVSFLRLLSGAKDVEPHSFTPTSCDQLAWDVESLNSQCTLHSSMHLLRRHCVNVSSDIWNSKRNCNENRSWTHLIFKSCLLQIICSRI